jgi:hypothetical protein
MCGNIVRVCSALAKKSVVGLSKGRRKVAWLVKAFISTRTTIGLVIFNSLFNFLCLPITKYLNAKNNSNYSFI